MLSFWSEVMSSPSHYITSPVPWDAFSCVLHRACFICGGSRCLKLLGSCWGWNVGAEMVLAPVRPGALGPGRNGWLWVADSRSVWRWGSVWHSADVTALCCSPGLARSVVAPCPVPGSSALGEGASCGPAWLLLGPPLGARGLLGSAGWSRQCSLHAHCFPLGGNLVLLSGHGLCGRVPRGSPQGRFNFSCEHCSVE